MLSFTLDTNCIIALDEDRPEATCVRVLERAHAEQRADVALVAIMASERQKANRRIENFVTFSSRLEQLGISHLRQLLPMAYFDVTFLDRSLWASEAMVQLEERIHEILFPGISFSYLSYCKLKNLDANIPPHKQAGVWINAKCDVQTIWAHIHNNRDVFVTNDSVFHQENKKDALTRLGANRIERPARAALLVAGDL